MAKVAYRLTFSDRRHFGTNISSVVEMVAFQLVSSSSSDDRHPKASEMTSDATRRFQPFFCCSLLRPTLNAACLLGGVLCLGGARVHISLRLVLVFGVNIQQQMDFSLVEQPEAWFYIRWWELKAC